MIRTNTIKLVNGGHIHLRTGMEKRGNFFVSQEQPSEVYRAQADLLLPCVFFCKTDTCPDDTYRCNYNGECVPNSSVCDGFKNCPKFGDDEANCTTDSPITPNLQQVCTDGFDYIYDRCVLVDPFMTSNWEEARYLCDRFSSDLVMLNDYNFYAALLQYIKSKGETQLGECSHSRTT